MHFRSFLLKDQTSRIDCSLGKHINNLIIMEQNNYQAIYRKSGRCDRWMAKYAKATHISNVVKV